MVLCHLGATLGERFVGAQARCHLLVLGSHSLADFLGGSWAFGLGAIGGESTAGAGHDDDGGERGSREVASSGHEVIPLPYKSGPTMRPDGGIGHTQFPHEAIRATLVGSTMRFVRIGSGASPQPVSRITCLLEIVGEDLVAQLPQLLLNSHALSGAQVELGQQVFDRSVRMQSRFETCKHALRFVGSVCLLQAAQR